MLKTIKTAYWAAGEIVRTIASANANRAVTQCVAHMQVNHYGAGVAEVYDDTTGELHAIVKRSVTGRIWIDYEKDPRDYETKIRLAGTPLLKGK